MHSGLLPVRPRPFSDELFSSWLLRLCHANAQRLPYFTGRLTGDANFWTRDPDRFLRPGVIDTLSEATGLDADAIEALTLREFGQRLLPALPPKAQVRWITPLNKRGYRCALPGLAYCPLCLQEAPYLRRFWRLSFVTLCERHGIPLLDVCPACAAPYAPQRHDLGRGRDWTRHAAPPFGLCAACGAEVGRSSPGEPQRALQTVQAWMLGGLRTGTLPWPGEGAVPAREGFDVMHQLLTLALTAELQAHLIAQGLPALAQPSPRPNRTFEDHGLADRRALLLHLATLLEGWPDGFVDHCRAAGLAKSPLVHHLRPVPAWYGAVANRLSRRGGRPVRSSGPLIPRLDRAGLAREREQAPTPSERQRWTILEHYHALAEVSEVAQQLGLSYDLVRRTVARYNAQGPAGIRDLKRGQPNRKKRLLTAEQENELQLVLPMSYAEMADWVEARTGTHPNPTTLWMYRRKLDSHSRGGRRASKTT